MTEVKVVYSSLSPALVLTRDIQMTIVKHRNNLQLTAALVLLSLTCSIGVFAQSNQTSPEAAQNTYIEGAILWQQTSGERRALSYQAFTLARMMLDRDLRLNRRNRKRGAVIVDLDETILDNSRYEGMLLKNRVNYNQRDWTGWINRAEATAVPGAIDFLRYAGSH